MAAIADRTTERWKRFSSAGMAFVSHEYPTHAHHTTASSAMPRTTPAHVRFVVRKRVIWVMANTNTRSKNSSKGVTSASSSPVPMGNESVTLIRTRDVSACCPAYRLLFGKTLSSSLINELVRKSGPTPRIGYDSRAAMSASVTIPMVSPSSVTITAL